MSKTNGGFMANFKAGDTVKLKSGGPLMSVVSVNSNEAWCEWFDDKKQSQGRNFNVAILIADDGFPKLA